jgi:hypothetical protein
MFDILGFKVQEVRAQKKRKLELNIVLLELFLLWISVFLSLLTK